MTRNRTLGTVLLTELSLPALNVALRRIQARVDEIKGLKGRSLIWDRVRGDDPEDTEDFVTKQFGAATFVDIENPQEITGQKTFATTILLEQGARVNGGSITGIEPAVLRWIDLNNQLIHAWGTAT